MLGVNGMGVQTPSEALLTSREGSEIIYGTLLTWMPSLLAEPSFMSINYFFWEGTLRKKIE